MKPSNLPLSHRAALFVLAPLSDNNSEGRRPPHPPRTLNTEERGDMAGPRRRLWLGPGLLRVFYYCWVNLSRLAVDLFIVWLL